MISTLKELKESYNNLKDRVEAVNMNSEMSSYFVAMAEDNRRLRQPKVEKFYHDMLANRFYRGNDMLCVSEESKSINGLHRTTAGSQLPQGRSFPAYIRFGVPKDELPVFDIGTNRDYEDYKFFQSGVCKDNFFKSPKTIRSIAKSILSHGMSHTTSVDHLTVEEFEKRYSQEINYMAGLFPNKLPKITVAPNLAIMLQAKIHLAGQEDKEVESRLNKLIEFISKGLNNLDNPEQFDGRQTLNRYLEYLLRDSTMTSDSRSHRDVYLKCMNFVKNFVYFTKEVDKPSRATKNFFPIDTSWIAGHTVNITDKIPFILGSVYDQLVAFAMNHSGEEFSVKELASQFGMDAKDLSAKLARLMKSANNEYVEFSGIRLEKVKRGQYKFDCLD